MSSAAAALLFLLLATAIPSPTSASLRRFSFHVRYANLTRLCSTTQVATVNGEVPGPTLFVREGDNVLVKVVNDLPDKNVTIHWHGIRQLRTGWADGPAYVTQCPMKPGTVYTYNFTVTGQRGTLWWHAHLHWMRATIYGALVVLPPLRRRHPAAPLPYPFPRPAAEIPLVLGEWWTSNLDSLLLRSNAAGLPPPSSDAFTINGQPGGLYPCSAAQTTVISVVPRRTYLLRIVNAAMNGELFLRAASHNFTVVEADAVYTKPFVTDTLFIAPGQSLGVLLHADQPPSRYYLAARPYIAPNVSLDNTTATAIIEYAGIPDRRRPEMPSMPALADTGAATAFDRRLRSLRPAAAVPESVDRRLFFTIGLALRPCATCMNGTRLVGAVNNISFVLPTAEALLEAHYQRRREGVFVTDFPDNPTSEFNFTGKPPANALAKAGTRLSFLPYNSTVEVVLQDTSIIAPENHPIHLHGYNFFVVGSGFGNFDEDVDRKSFNLVDPPERNTVAVPMGGWAAIRFRADNPGVWFMHCHLEFHTSIGLALAFVVEDGPRPQDKLHPPPSDLPAC